MSKKLTKEIVNERIMARGIELVGEYTNNQAKTDFLCNNSHIWSAEPASVMRGRGCPSCADISLTKEIVNNRIADNGIRLIGDYANQRRKSLFKCDCGYEWYAKPSNLMLGTGCPRCSERIKLTKEVVNERLSSKNITLISDYITNSTRSEFQCICGYKWFTTPSNIMRASGCPVCADYGYNPGKPGWLYILIFAGFIKYGITNNLEGRLYTHKRKNGEYTIAITKLYQDGVIAQNWEKSIKIIFGGRHITKEIMPDGYTETLSLDKLELLLETVK